MSFLVQTVNSPPGSIKSDIAETLRYLGYGKHAPDTDTAALIDECIKESPRCCYIRVPVVISSDSVELGFGEIKSRSLCKNLGGCDEAWVFAATIGIEADRMIARYGKTSPSKSVIVDALASSAIECWCDEINRMLCIDLKCRPRFSPGYGDFDIGHQKSLMSLLDTAVKIGLTLTDSMLMLPTKSVTAVIGISKNEDMQNDCDICLSCDKKSCMYKK